MASFNKSMRDLKDAIKDSLEKTGTLSEVRARLRAEIFHNLLQDEGVPAAPISNENLIINELIREYLRYNGYLFTDSIFLAESGQPQTQAPRNRLEEQLRIKSTKEAEDLPLLYGLVFQDKNQIQEDTNYFSEKKCT